MAENNVYNVTDSDWENAWIDNGKGVNVCMVKRSRGVLDTVEFLSTLDQWQAIVDLIEAAPQMLTVLQEVDRYLDDPHKYTSEGTLGIVNAVRDIVAQVAPKKVTVQVTVEVEVPAGSEYEMKANAINCVTSGKGLTTKTVIVR
jgi:hypothetical protein